MADPDELGLAMFANQFIFLKESGSPTVADRAAQVCALLGGMSAAWALVFYDRTSGTRALERRAADARNIRRFVERCRVAVGREERRYRGHQGARPPHRLTAGAER